MQTEIEVVNRLLELGAAKPGGQQFPGGDPFIVVPSGMKVENLAGLCPPTRIRRAVSLLESGSFIDYVNRFKQDSTMVFADVGADSGKFVAVLDYHASAPELKPGYCNHTATFTPIKTEEFCQWMSANKKRMTQEEFATWLEENAAVLTEPTGAELLELVTTLHGRVDARFNQTIRLQTGGCKLQYDEDVTVRGTAGTSSKPGEMELPAQIKAGIAPFQGSPMYEIRARLKVRTDNRKLALWFETIAPHKIVRDSLLLITKEIAEKTGIIPLLGVC
jgi:uncharacterized protein YfdQ (DUF2303 family)